MVVTPGGYVSRQRLVLYALCGLALAAGLAAAGLGALVQATPEPRDPRSLALDASYTAPERVLLAGDLVVYGTPPTNERPTLDELGCQVSEGGGPLSTEAAAREDRIVVEDRGLVPLVSFPGEAGHSIACTGPAAVAAAPLYVVPGATARDLVPLAGYSVAALLLPLGAVGLLMLRASQA